MVIGSGVVGLFCAYFLRLAGANVLVAERGQAAGPQSCSYGNTGFVGTQGARPLAEPGVVAQGMRWLADPRSPFYVRPRPDPGLAAWLWAFRRACNDRDVAASSPVLLDLKRRSLEILREICAPGGLDGALSPPGMLIAFRTQRGFDQACRSVPGLVASGVPVRALGPGELRELEPDAEFDVAGALFNSDGGFLRVPAFLADFARLVADLGVTFSEHTEVTGFEVAGRTVTTVRTTRGDFRPREVVIAAGAWSARCGRGLDLGLLLQPAKGYSVTVAAPPGSPRLPVLLSEGKVAISPLGDRLRFGGTLELSGLDGRESQRRIDGIGRTVSEYLPGLGPAVTLETWSGLRPITPDGLPYLGRAERCDNVLVATGHGHTGMGLAPASGRLIAQLIGGERPDCDLAPLRPGRYRGFGFARGRRPNGS